MALNVASKERAAPFPILARAPFLLLVIGLLLRLAELGQKIAFAFTTHDLAQQRQVAARAEGAWNSANDFWHVGARSRSSKNVVAVEGWTSVVAAAGSTAITKNGTTRRNLLNMASPINS